MFIIVDDDADDDFAVAVVAVIVSVLVACFSIGVFIAFIVFDDDDDHDFVVAAVVILVVVGRFSVSAFLEGDFFFFLVSSVHPLLFVGMVPSFGLWAFVCRWNDFRCYCRSGSYCICRCRWRCYWFLVVFCGPDLEKCPSCLQNQHWGFNDQHHCLLFVI